jgi:hypothetical protein
VSTKLEGDSSIKREIVVTGIGPVQVEISSEGLSFWVKGSRKRVRTSWMAAIEAGSTGYDVPSYLEGRPVELLRHQRAKIN